MRNRIAMATSLALALVACAVDDEGRGGSDAGLRNDGDAEDLSEGTGDGTGDGTCIYLTGECLGVCAGIGGPCTSDADCFAGLYCGPI